MCLIQFYPKIFFLPWFKPSRTNYFFVHLILVREDTNHGSEPWQRLPIVITFNMAKNKNLMIMCLIQFYPKIFFLPWFKPSRTNYFFVHLILVREDTNHGSEPGQRTMAANHGRSFNNL